MPPLPSRTPRAGDRLDGGRYVLVRKLGAGGNGVVWLAQHTAMNHSEVAIKFPISLSQNDGAGHVNFDQEMDTLIAFSNRQPNIVNMIDAGKFRGKPFVVMQYLTRGSLLNFVNGACQDTSPLAQRFHTSGRWLVSIADALDFLHANGLLHRDVKPANILLDESYSAYLADFGISAVTGTQPLVERLRNVFNDHKKIVGSLAYIAPEVLRGEEPTPASDQYGLAVTAYEYFSGQRPFEASTPNRLIERHTQDQPTSLRAHRPDIRLEVWKSIRKALSTQPRDRYADCSQFAAALSSCWPNLSSPANRRRTNRPLPSSRQKRPPEATLTGETPTATGKASAKQTPPDSPSTLNAAPETEIAASAAKPPTPKVLKLSRIMREKKS